MNAVVFDVDGVLTDGTFTYTEHGKVSKVFGPHDADALKILAQHFQIEFITADLRGFAVTRKRVGVDMGWRLSLVDESSTSRLDYLRTVYGLDCAFMADGFLDAPALDAAAYSIAPQNAHSYAKRAAHYVTGAFGGHGAVAEACEHLLIKFRGVDLLGRTVKS